MAVGMPWFLTGFYHWKQPHIVAHIDRYSICQVKRVGTTQFFYAVFDWPNGWIGISMDPDPLPLRWNIQVNCHIHPNMWDTQNWLHVVSISDDRFDTGLLTATFIEGIHFRELHLRGPYLQWPAP